MLRAVNCRVTVGEVNVTASKSFGYVDCAICNT